MPPSDAKIVDSFAWEGVANAHTAVGIAIVLAALSAWLLWRERHALGTVWGLTFWALRVIAFGCALWMLAGPTQLRIHRTTTPQGIAVFADDSESMDVVDPPDPVDSPRWALAGDAKADHSPLAQCDRLAVALGVALRECENLARRINEHMPVTQLSEGHAMVAKLVQRAAHEAAAVESSLEDRDQTLAERAGGIASLLGGSVAESLESLGDALATSQRGAGGGPSADLEQTVAGLTSAHRKTLVLAADLTAAESAERTGSQSAADAMTRREKAGRALDAFESAMHSSLDASVRVRRYRFDRRPTPVGVDQGWGHALASAPQAESEPLAHVANGGAASGSETASAAASTNLSAVLEQLASERIGESTRLAVILSDGRHNDADAQPPQDIAAQLSGLPVYLVPIGNSQEVRDVLLHRVEAPSAVAENDEAIIDVIVTGFDCDGQSSAVVLRHEGKEVDRKEFQFAGHRGDFRTQFTVPAKELGWQEYVVEVEPAQDEANTSNNYMPVSFEVVRNETRVLLADGVARWEFRYLSQLFRRDDHVKFDELLFFPRLQGTGKLADHPEFPRDVEGWARYDVVILGDLTPQQLPAASQKSLLDYVTTRGGNVILIAGRTAMPAAFAGQPLMELLPVERSAEVLPRQGYGITVSEEGRLNSALAIADSPEESRQTWQTIYERFPVYGLSEFCTPKSTAHTLLEATPEAGGGEQHQALLCWQRVGAGRVAYLAAPDTYRLRWRHGDLMHHRFWGQFLRWMTAATAGSGGDRVRLQTDRTRYNTGEPVEVTAWLKDADGRPIAGESISAEARNFNNEAVATELSADPDVPGRYFATFDDLSAGAYQIELAGKIIDQLIPPGAGASPVQATIAVQAADGIEMVNTQANRALLEQVAQMTGGQVIPPTALGELLELVSFTPQVSERVERTPLWNRWSNLFIVLGCLFTEWTVRKSKGLA